MHVIIWDTREISQDKTSQIWPIITNVIPDLRSDLIWVSTFWFLPISCSCGCVLRSGKPAIADSSPHRLRQSISDTKLFWLPLQPPYTKSLHRRCRVNYENWNQIMFSSGGVLYKDNGSLHRFVEISKLAWNCTIDGWSMVTSSEL